MDMAHDLIVRDGLIVDGTGTEPYVGDVAIDGDRIAAVGKVEGDGHQEINAAGHAIPPGFVDLLARCHDRALRQLRSHVCSVQAEGP